MKGLRYHISLLLLWVVSMALTAQDNPPKFMVDYNNESVATTVSQSDIGFARSSDGTNYSLSTDGKYHSQYDLSNIKYINRYYEPMLLLSTSEIDFGIVEIGETKTYPLSVTNKGLFPEYIHATCLGDFTIAQGDREFLLEPGQSLTLDVSYAPTGEMNSNGSLALTSSAMRGGSENVILRGIGTEFDPQAHVFPEVVPNSTDNAETLLCDTLNGKYTVNYEGEVPEVKEGNVVFVNNDSTTYIVLVTNVTRDGNVVSFDGKRGDLSYVFHDVSFILSTAADDVLITRLNGKETSRRVKLGGPMRVRDTKRLFDKKKDFDIPIVKKGDAKFSLEGSFHPTLDCEMYFEFYEPIYDVFEGYAFTKAGLFRSGVKFIGELKTECNLNVNVKKKSEKYEYDEKEPKLIKENFLPKKNWDFVVFGVPVRVSFGCDLFEKAYMYCKGEFEMYQGFVSTITGTYGFSYDPNDYFNGYVPIKDVDIQFERTDPTVKGKLEAGLKAYLIPRFYARIYDLVGPCVELKPYFDVNLGGAFQEEFIDASENGSDTDYITTYLNASFGVDWGLGFSVLDEIEFKKFADKTWDMGKTFIDPVYLLRSPSDLLLTNESTKKVRKGKPIDLTFDAQCKFLWGSYSSPFFPVIKIDIPKRNFHTYLFTLGNGKADYKWIPQTDDEEIYAMVYDKDGKAVKTICLPNPEDNSMRANTEEATNVTANSAVLNGKFDSGNTVVIDKMGFIYSSVSQVPKYFDENCTFVEVDFDDVMEKSRLVEGLSPGTTYYFRAYASNRYGSDYGNVLSFTTEGQTSLQLSATSLTLTPGSQGTVDVTSGSGSYDAVSNAKDVATVSVEGSKIIIKAVSPGSATITVKDNQTQERAKIEVTVNEVGSFKGQIVMERKYLIHHHNKYNYPTVTFHFDYDDRGLVLGYFDTDYYEGYGKKLQGIYIFSVKDGRDGTNYHEKKNHTKEWYIAPVVLDQWVKEKIVINDDGRIQYYMNDQYMGEEVFDQLPLKEAQTIRVSISPWGWWTGMYEYMDDFSLTTPAASISDDFNDGVINTNIWRAPVNPDGVREEDGIIKMEQLRTDQDFNMYTLPIPLGGFTPQAYLTCPDDHHPHLIDLGLPSGTKWACCNVDDDHSKQSPTNYGSYYAWGEVKGKDYYDWSTYTHSDGTMETCYDLGSDIAGTGYDVAHVKWGGSWVMPTHDQQMELLDKCTYEWTTVNGVRGGKFTSKTNGGSIFLPAAGNRWNDDLYYAGSYGDYWSSTQTPSDSGSAYRLHFGSGDTNWGYYYYRYGGRTVRPVSR